MEIKNPKYKNQGIHLIASIFTVDKGIVKVLLIKRKNEPFKNKWALTGGALYNDEDLIDGLKREIKEKTGLEEIDLRLCDVFGKKNRSPVMRMVAVSYIGIIDHTKVEIMKETLKTSNAEWFDIETIPDLAYDHNEILIKSIRYLKQKILNTDMLKSLYPNGFTIPEIQKIYETILEKKLDRRNFRKKMLNLDLIEDTNKEVNFEGRKKAKLYKFKETDENKEIFRELK